MGTNHFDSCFPDSSDDVDFTKSSDDTGDMDIDDFDWSGINTRDEKQPEHLYEEYELDQIQVWMRNCLNGMYQSVDDLSELVGQVCLPDLVDDLDWITLWTDMLGNKEFDSCLAKEAHRNRQRKLSPIHLMGAVLNHPETTIVDRHDYYATWLPELGITVISVYSADPQDIYHHALALGYIEGAYSVTQTNNIMPMLCWIWRWYTEDISRWEFHYDNEDSPCGTGCLLNNELVNEHIRLTISTSAETTAGERVDDNRQGTLTYSNGDTYVGEWKNSKENGLGTYTFKSGSKYVGEFKGGYYNGQGTFSNVNGDRYIGEWKANKENGLGTFTSVSGNKYVGAFKDGKRNGQGTLIYSNGDTYVGEWKANKKNGQGTYSFLNGNTYVGEFKDGKKNGQGTLTYWNSNTYIGEFKDGMSNGHGTLTYSNGNTYVGDWKGNTRHGLGTLTYSNGDKYVGAWKGGGQQNRQGILTYSNSNTYIGEWKANKENGQGTYTYADGGIYVGAFKDGKKNGQGTETHENGVFIGEWTDDGYDKGTLTYSDGMIMAGEWDDNLLNGQGTYTKPNGETYIGEWEDGFLNGQGTLIYSNGDTYVGEFKEKPNRRITFTDEKGNTYSL